MINTVVKEGDSVFYQFEEGTIKEVKNGRVAEVKHGCILTSGHDLRVIPITDETRKISRTYSNLSDDIRDASKCMNLNWPDLSHYMETLWYNNCLASIAKDKESLKIINKEFKKFSTGIFKAIDKAKTYTICNIRLFR